MLGIQAQRFVIVAKRLLEVAHLAIGEPEQVVSLGVLIVTRERRAQHPQRLLVAAPVDRLSRRDVARVASRGFLFRPLLPEPRSGEDGHEGESRPPWACACKHPLGVTSWVIPG